MRYLTALIAAVAMLSTTLAQAELILSAAPREDKNKGFSTYAPLAETLSAALGERVTYKHPSSWAEYSDNIRNDKYDILLDGPHLTSWRIKHTGFTPVARLPGLLSFKFVSLKSNKKFIDIASLQWAKVCAFATPNLTSVVLLDRYRNEVMAPKVVPIKGTMRDIFRGLLDNKCDAAVLRDQFYDKKLKAEEKATLNIIFQTREFPNQGISVSKRVSLEQQKLISEILQGDASIQPIIDRFAKNATQFVPSKLAEYKDARDLLEGVVWGW